MARTRRDPGFHLTNAVMIFYFSAFILLALRDLRWEPLAMAFAVPLTIWAGSNLLNRLFPVDALLMTLTNFLCGLGILILWSTDPARCLNQCLFYGLGLIGMIICICLVRLIRHWTGTLCVLMPVGIAFIILPLLFGR